ncbi:MAG TPA: 16S rRNA (adenine(1518)-N(6)/adenine(1519)-N(6))-dimethyltransferase RsmA [Candidatus Paceibacterota bacterium]|nr:16S rRNA (adenine(1518)-N(6)/adenine(1519)-N(6))-dimethyltransferase RsmA [Candidatus Paceibacterota bacterium]
MFAKKSLGQNFLMHRQTAERIVAAADLPADATVLEIGPGRGMLTRALLERAGKVVAVEADASLISELEETFAAELAGGKLELVSGDIRAFDASALPEDYHLVANIPYYLTGELLRSFLAGAHKPASMTFLVQKEVAERVARSEKESLLSIAVKAYGTPKCMFTVPRGAFVPAPNVDSAVLHISSISGAHFDTTKDEERFFDIVRAGFAHKRKQLAKNLEGEAPRTAVLEALESLALPSDVRAEDVPLASWLALSKRLSN